MHMFFFKFFYVISKWSLNYFKGRSLHSQIDEGKTSGITCVTEEKINTSLVEIFNKIERESSFGPNRIFNDFGILIQRSI